MSYLMVGQPILTKGIKMTDDRNTDEKVKDLDSIVKKLLKDVTPTIEEVRDLRKQKIQVATFKREFKLSCGGYRYYLIFSKNIIPPDKTYFSKEELETWVKTEKVTLTIQENPE